ncbi:unnamed protein product [Phyllotreta striolata]|uniref:Uncharacterized protein n=1 Tax=Phyllotreta striolata TaxID=444603 RepID=A0A9N9TPT3_PHYSR|nr:unnamed protein product [Phyllotreta striolata]
MLFSAEITDFKIIYNVLKAIAFKDNILFRPMEEGLKLTLEEMNYIEISIYIPSSIFSSYNVDSNDEIIFKISLKKFVEVLNMFGDEGNPNIKLTYASTGAPLCIVLTNSNIEENITVDCEIQTLNLHDFHDISLAEECNTNKIVVNASILVELLSRLNNSADELKVTLSPDQPYFTLTATGISGKSEVSISKNSQEVTVYQCQTTTSAVYCFNNIKHVLKVMAYADKVSISTGESGLLRLQLVMNSEDRQMFVEYYATSQYM